MKKIILLLLAVILLSTIVFARNAPILTANVLRYEPLPAEQGRTVDIWIKISNAGTQADNVMIKFEPDYPFSLPAGAQSEFNIGVIPATEDVVVKFSIFIDATAPTGERDITFLFKHANLDNWAKLEYPLTLQSKGAGLVIKDFILDPKEIVPGQKAKLRILLENAGKIDIKNAEVILDLPEYFSAVEGSSKKRIEFLASDTETNVEFTLASDSSTKVNVYSIPINLKYQDIASNDYSDSSEISLIVNAEPEIDMFIDSADFKGKTSPGVVSLKVVNKGVVDVKFVSVALVKAPDYEILMTSSKEYLGNLDSDDFETVDFRIEPDVKYPNLYVELEFKDPYNKPFKKSFVLPLKIFSKRQLGLAKSPFGTIIFLLIAGGIVYYIYRRRKKKKKGKKK